MHEYLSGSFGFVKEGGAEVLRRAVELVYPRERPLVCVDIEAYERNPTKVTEIGFAVYDPALQINLILPRVQVIHLIIKEHRRLFNGRFVPDNKLKCASGVSHEVSLPQAKLFCDRLVLDYLGERHGVLVGHHVQLDVRWLHQSGVDIPPEVPVVDTGTLYQLSRSSGGTLRGLLETVGIPHANLHNAANDAYYTLLAALAYTDPQTRRQCQLDEYVEVPKKAKRLNDKATVVDAISGRDLYAQLLAMPKA